MQDASQATATTQAATAPSIPVVLQPSRSFTLTGIDPRFSNLTVAADGKAVYVLSTRPAVNLWKTVVGYSPEILTILGCVMTLLVLRRVARRPQVVGERYCRQCNYLLRNHESERCSECGGEVSERSVMRGARRKPRVVLLTSLMAMFVVLYLSNGLELLRFCSATEWLDWRSTSLADKVPVRWRYLNATMDQVWSIDRIDLQTGALTVTLLDARDALRGLAFAADGQSMAVWGEKGVYRYALPDCSLLDSMTLEDVRDSPGWSDRLIDARFSPDLQQAYLINNYGTVDRWTLATHVSTPLMEIPSVDAGPARFAKPDSAEHGIAVFDYRDSGTLTLFNVNSVTAPMVVMSVKSPACTPVLRPDFRSCILFPLSWAARSRGTAEAMIVWNLLDGQQSVLDAFPTGAAPYLSTVSPNGRWVIVESIGSSRDLYLWELASGRCVFQLAASGIGPIAFAPVDEFTVARLFSTKLAGKVSTYQLDLFDLPQDSPH